MKKGRNGTTKETSKLMKDGEEDFIPRGRVEMFDCVWEGRGTMGSTLRRLLSALDLLFGGS